MSESILDDLPSAQILHADEVCLRFEEAWKAGEHPNVESYLLGVPDSEKEFLLRELLLGDRQELTYLPWANDDFVLT